MNRSTKPRSIKTNRTSQTTSAKPSQQALSDRELEDALTEKLDRESNARLGKASAPSPITAREKKQMEDFERRTLGRKLDIPIRPGMVIHDCPGERIGVVWYCFNAIDLAVYMDQAGQLHQCKISETFIEPRPLSQGARLYFPAHLHPPETRKTEGMKLLGPINDLFLHIGDLLTKLRQLALPAGCRDFLHEYPATLRNHVRAMLSDMHEFHANLMDELIGNQDMPERVKSDALRSSEDLKAAGAAFAA